MPWKLSKSPNEEFVLGICAAVGLLLYWRLWGDIFGIADAKTYLCGEGFVPYYGITFLVAPFLGLGLGVLFPGKSLLIWFPLVVPSFIARYMNCSWGLTSNLLPPIFLIDALSTLLILACIAVGSWGSPRLTTKNE
jgi:hypothetical protein